MPKIEKMFAFVIDYGGPRGEGIVGMMDATSKQWMPLVGADMKRVEELRPFAQAIATSQNKPIEIIEFTGRRTLAVLKPE